jgi:hypothetical protein
LARGIIAMKFKENTTLSEEFEKNKAMGTKMRSQLILDEHNVFLNEFLRVKGSSSLW